MLNLSVILEDSARRYPTKDAFILNDAHFSYEQINQAANQIAHGLQSIGIKKGDKVALSCPNLPYFPMAYFGILKAGAVVVPLSILLKREEVEYHLQNSDAKVLLSFEGTPQLPLLEENYAGFQKVDSCEHLIVITANPVAPSPIEGLQTLASLMHGQSSDFETEATGAEDTAVIVYTSGTTGKPKGAQLTHSNILLNTILCSNNILKGNTDDKMLVALPLFHIFSMVVVMNASIYTGGTGILLPRFEPEAALATMQKHGISIFAGVPTMYWALVNHKSEKIDFNTITQKLKVCVSGGASLPVQVLKDFEARFGVKVQEGFGMSEGSPVITFNHLEIGIKAGSIGTPVWGVEVKVVDENGHEVPIGEKGELIYRGHNVMKGYYKNDAANAETIKNGWLHSGDVAIQDEDGFFYIVDRIKEMIIRGGLNVYPREVEELMMKHEAVSLVAVIGVPDEESGEEIKAFVVLKDGHSVKESELIEWTKNRISAYKYPRQIEFVPGLPMTASGKILKKELR